MVSIRSKNQEVRKHRNLSLNAVLCDSKSLHSKKNLNFQNISILRNFHQNQLINECAIKNLVKWALCELS